LGKPFGTINIFCISPEAWSARVTWPADPARQPSIEETVGLIGVLISERRFSAYVGIDGIADIGFF
jgi:hypothetical protein